MLKKSKILSATSIVAFLTVACESTPSTIEDETKLTDETKALEAEMKEDSKKADTAEKDDGSKDKALVADQAEQEKIEYEEASMEESKETDTTEERSDTENTQTSEQEVEKTESNAASSEYLVQDGDTLGLISEKLFGSKNRWRELAELNSLENPNLIYVGQKLMVPSDTGTEPEKAKKKQPVAKEAKKPVATPAKDASAN